MNKIRKNINKQTRYKEEAKTSNKFKYLLSLSTQEIAKRKENLANELKFIEEKIEYTKKNLIKSLWGDLLINPGPRISPITSYFS